MTDITDRLYERVLVVRCQAGDEAAFAELVQRYQPRLRYYLRKLLGDADVAEDVLQDVWLDVFRAVPRLTEAGAFRSWLYRIARDRAFRLLRKRRVRFEPLDELELPDAGADGDDLDTDDAQHVHECLNQLAAPHREVLVLRYIEDMNYDEIARVIGCQVGTVRSRLYYGKRALREVVERKNFDD
jgi:RNA polymerase sigma-70 factor (ECF subfamily)